MDGEAVAVHVGDRAGVGQLLGLSHRLADPRAGLIHVTTDEKSQSQVAQADCALVWIKSEGRGLVRVMDGERMLEMMAGRDRSSLKEQNRSNDAMSYDLR